MITRLIKEEMKMLVGILLLLLGAFVAYYIADSELGDGFAMLVSLLVGVGCSAATSPSPRLTAAVVACRFLAAATVVGLLICWILSGKHAHTMLRYGLRGDLPYCFGFILWPRSSEGQRGDEA